MENRMSRKKNKVIIRIFTCFFTLVLFSCSSFKNKTWDEDFIINPKYQTFAESLEQYLSETSFSGSVLLAQNKDIIFAKGYGLCDPKDQGSQKITIHTVFESGSLTKLPTACCVMLLAQKNKLSTEDTLEKYFSDYKYAGDITIDLLLKMRSGLTDCINSPDEFFPPDVLRSLEKKMHANESVEENLVLNYFYSAPLMTAPDSTYFYCNTNYYLLAKIVENVSGLSFGEYIKKNVFDVAGMNHTNTQFQRTDSVGYDYKGRYFSIPSELAFGSGDMNSSVLDLYKMNTAFAEGKIVKKKMIKKMTNSESYGYGVYCRDNVIFHSGVTNVFNSYNSYDFTDKLSVIVLINAPVSSMNATFFAGNIRKMWEEYKESF